MKRRSICCQLRQFNQTSNRCIKPPPPFSHTKFRNFRVAFPHLTFISRTSCQCAIALAHRSFRQSTQESETRKRPHPQVLKINQSHEDCSSTAVRLHKIFDPYHFRMRRSLNGRASLIGGFTVSIVGLASVGFFRPRRHGRPTPPLDWLFFLF